MNFFRLKDQQCSSQKSWTKGGLMLHPWFSSTAKGMGWVKALEAEQLIWH